MAISQSDDKFDRIEIAENWVAIPAGPYFFWSVSINGNLIWPKARPFGPRDSQIVLSECDQCGHCGSPNVSVRRVGSRVIWFGGNPDPHVSGPDEQFSRGQVFAFEVAAYEAALGESVDTAQILEPAGFEILQVLGAQGFPTRELPIVRLPDSQADPNGDLLLNALRREFEPAIEQGQRINELLLDKAATRALRARLDDEQGLHVVSHSPPSFEEIRLLYWSKDEADTVIGVARYQAELIMRMQQRPKLPFWISKPRWSDDLMEALADVL